MTTARATLTGPAHIVVNGRSICGAWYNRAAGTSSAIANTSTMPTAVEVLVPPRRPLSWKGLASMDKVCATCGVSKPHEDFPLRGDGERRRECRTCRRQRDRDLRAARPKRPRPSPEERFWAKVDLSDADGCWPWTAGSDKDGYGKFRLTLATGIYIDERAHRYSLGIKIGRTLVPGEMALHRCDHPPCVNPDHLFLGDANANSQDMVAKGRHPSRRLTHCPKGHEYSESNVIRNARGHRRCRECVREYHRRPHVRAKTQRWLAAYKARLRAARRMAKAGGGS